MMIMTGFVGVQNFVPHYKIANHPCEVPSFSVQFGIASLGNIHHIKNYLNHRGENLYMTKCVVQIEIEFLLHFNKKLLLIKALLWM